MRIKSKIPVAKVPDDNFIINKKYGMKQDLLLKIRK